MPPRRKKTDTPGAPAPAAGPLRPYQAGQLRLEMTAITEADKKAGRSANIRVALTRDEHMRLQLWAISHGLEPGAAARHLIVRGLPRRLMVAWDEADADAPAEAPAEGPAPTPAYTEAELRETRAALGLAVDPPQAEVA
jgi:hypothetical protein